MKKADNFNASKWLVENKITFQSRLNEEYSSERINQRDVEAAGGEINHTFDTVDVMDLDNGYQVKIVSTYYYRDPGVKGYSERNSEENPMISDIKTTLMDPSGKPIKNHNFTGSGQWWMLTSGKDKFIPYITDWWKQKIDKLGLSESHLNENEEEKKYYLAAKSKDGKKHEVFKKNPNYIKTTYDSALELINSLKKPKHYIYYVSDIDGNPVDKDGNIINEGFQENYEYLELEPEDFKPGDFFLMAPDEDGEFFEHKEKVKILSVDLPKDGRSNTTKVKTEDGKEMNLSNSSLYDIARSKK